MTRLMRQTLIWDELRHTLEDYYFEGSLAEQKALIFSLVKMSKKLITVLYKKSFAFTLVKQKNPPPEPSNIASIITFGTAAASSPKSQPQNKITEVLWKDTLSESRAYIQML